jgi:hypothetical protein
MGVGGQCHTPATLPPGKTHYPLYSRLGGPQGWSGWVRKISPSPGIWSPDCPVHSKSLCYPGPRFMYSKICIWWTTNIHSDEQLLVQTHKTKFHQNLFRFKDKNVFSPYYIIRGAYVCLLQAFPNPGSQPKLVVMRAVWRVINSQNKQVILMA